MDGTEGRHPLRGGDRDCRDGHLHGERRGRLLLATYTLKAKFDNVVGLKPGAPVRVAGVEVGTVEDVAFYGTDVEVTFQLSREMQPRITTNSVAVIGSVSLLGEASLDSHHLQRRDARPRLRLRAEPAHARPAGRRGGRRDEALEQATQLIRDIRRQGHGGQAVYRRDAHRDVQGFVDAAENVAQSLRSGRGTLGQLLNNEAAYRIWRHRCGTCRR